MCDLPPGSAVFLASQQPKTVKPSLDMGMGSHQLKDRAATLAHDGSAIGPNARDLCLAYNSKESIKPPSSDVISSHHILFSHFLSPIVSCFE